MDVSPEQGLRAWVEYLRDLGVYDLYHRGKPGTVFSAAVCEDLLARGAGRPGQAAPLPPASETRAVAPPAAAPPQPAARPSLSRSAPPAPVRPAPPVSVRPASPVSAAEPVPTYFSMEEETSRSLPPELAAPMPKPQPLESLSPAPEAVPLPRRAATLTLLREEIGDCTRCPLAYAGRHHIVFGEGNPAARLMFVGEGPGADEDASGRPFVGKAGQLLGNMIQAMGLTREEVFIGNIVKCRPPGNRVPEFVEATTCSQFLLRQIDIVRPEVIVALGSTAATYLLGVRQSLTSLRGQWYQVRKAKVVVTFHPAYLLRDPRQKAEAWKDLQRVMAELELQPPAPRKSQA